MNSILSNSRPRRLLRAIPILLKRKLWLSLRLFCLLIERRIFPALLNRQLPPPSKLLVPQVLLPGVCPISRKINCLILLWGIFFRSSANISFTTMRSRIIFLIKCFQYYYKFSFWNVEHRFHSSSRPSIPHVLLAISNPTPLHPIISSNMQSFFYPLPMPKNPFSWSWNGRTFLLLFLIV